ncbi:hypothetical protein BDW02DRAFT_634506 [Decorospora gaudefroyi]|uniref:Endo-1,4-beta-xylanase n=1 Tax=Decorospora gaudefroyi TaxID=184978 RepID=A0A6A5K3X2_9PLEO|nr:hypothetical protein BDW02DRAFT_634506 [Decorospora gaudefroyi]
MHIRGSALYLAVVGLSSTSTVLAAVGPWGQCGGRNHQGETSCVSGSTCTKINDWYSQCIPGSNNGGSPAVTTTTAAAPTTTAVATSARPSATNIAGSGRNGAKCSLDAAFKAKGKRFFGVATDRNRLTVGDNAQIIKDNFGQVTPENSMKWDATENREGVWTLSTADYLVNFATENNKLIRGHTTVWHSQLPSWVSSIRDKQKLQEVMVAHIKKLMGTYAGKVHAWDVVNEIFNENGSLRSSVFYNVLGEDFVALAFNTARGVDPEAKLYINDYNLDSATYSKTQAMARKVKQWVAAGVPIDGVGSQSHLSNNWPISDFPGAMRLLCGAASECAVTELDVKGGSTGDYQTAVRACLDEDNCVGVTVWGVSDADSWIGASKETRDPILRQNKKAEPREKADKIASMGRNRAASNASTTRSSEPRLQELGSMYDYLAKVVLLGPSGAGKSCLLHRFVKSEWRILSSQTIGVEFSSKIVHIEDRRHSASTPSSNPLKRIKLQLWDTAGTERFRSVSRSYYRGAAAAILVYDVSSWRSFQQLGTFLDDARALAGPDITIILAGNKSDVEAAENNNGPPDWTLRGGHTSTLLSSTPTSSEPSKSPPQTPTPSSHSHSSLNANLHTHYTIAPDGREVPTETASRWAGQNGISVAVEVSALNGENVDALFERVARIILTKIELGEIDPDEPASGIQYEFETI